MRRRGLRFFLTRPFSWLAAAVSGFFLLYLGSVPSLFFSWVPFGTVHPVTRAIVSVASLALGISFGRFLLRVLPLHTDGRRRTGVLILGLLVSVAWLGGFSMFLIKGGPEPRPGQDAIWLTSTSFDERLTGFLATVTWWFGAFVPFLGRHLTPRSMVRRPFIAFLRRFSTFSDRSVVSAVLNCSPAGQPVAFLTPTARGVQDWNPFQVGFAGLKVWRPFRSMPIDLRAADQEWQPSAAELIAHARVIVLDASEGSDAIETEIEMIQRGGFGTKTIVLTGPERDEVSERRIARLANDPSRVVRYRKSWRAAEPRLFFGFFAAVFATLPLAVFLIMMVLNSSYDSQQLAQPVGLQEALRDSWPKLLPPCLALFLWIYYVLFVRPALDRDAVHVLKHLLRRGSGDTE